MDRLYKTEKIENSKGKPYKEDFYLIIANFTSSELSMAKIFHLSPLIIS